MNDRALKQLFDDLGRSLDRFAEALTVPEDCPVPAHHAAIRAVYDRLRGQLLPS